MCVVLRAVGKLGWSHWEDVFPYDPLCKLDYVKAFQHFLVIVGRQHGFVQIWVRSGTRQPASQLAYYVIMMFRDNTGGPPA